MRKPIYFSGAGALVAAATIFVWSSLLPHQAVLVAEAATSVMSSTEMTINYNRPLPVEQWDAF
jgi:hypothetical protein